MKNILLLSAVGLSVAFAPVSHAQDARWYQYAGLNGGTNKIVANSTNSYSGIACAEYDRADFQLTIAAVAATAGTVQVMGYKSLDSTSYETSPSLVQYITLNGTTAVTTIVTNNVGNAGSFKLSLGNTNATVALTNVNVGFRFKANSVRLKTN